MNQKTQPVILYAKQNNIPHEDIHLPTLSPEKDYREEYEAIAVSGRVVATFDTLDSMTAWKHRLDRGNIRYRRKTIICEEIKI